MNFDVQLVLALNGVAGASEGLDWMMIQLGQMRAFVFPTLLVVGYWLWYDWREAVAGALTLGSTVLVGDFLGAQLKHLVHRVRPCHALDAVHSLTGCGGTFSFPSNHALNTAALAAFAQVVCPVSGWVLWPVVLLVGLSRVYVGAHYVSDVLGGWLIGSALGVGVGLLFAGWRRRRHAGPGKAEPWPTRSSLT